MSDEKCYRCGGEVEVETVGEYQDLVCQDCGIVMGSEEMVVEDQAEFIEDGDIEIME